MKQYIEGEYQVTEYDSGTIVKVYKDSIIQPGETIPIPPTFSQQIVELQEKNKELESALVEMSALAAEQEQRNIQNEQAIMELTTMLAGGK